MKKIAIAIAFLGFVGFANAQEKTVETKEPTKQVELEKSEVKAVKPVSKNLNTNQKILMKEKPVPTTAVKADENRKDASTNIQPAKINATESKKEAVTKD